MIGPTNASWKGGSIFLGQWMKTLWVYLQSYLSACIESPATDVKYV